MPLDILLSDKGKPPRKYSPENFLRLEEDAYYWQLEPLFRKIAGQTGQRIELNGVAEFKDSHLLLLKSRLSQELDRVEKNKDGSWEVVSGQNAGPAASPTAGLAVSRHELVRLLNGFIRLVNSAIDRRESIICLGE